jgi:hypothetical protein
VAIAVGLRRPNSLVWCRQPETAEALNDLLRFDPLAANRATSAKPKAAADAEVPAGSSESRGCCLGQPARLPSARARPPCALSMLSG